MLFLIALFYKCWLILCLKYVSRDNYPPKLCITFTVLCMHLLNCFLKHIEETKSNRGRNHKSSIWGRCWTPWSMKRRRTLSGQCHNVILISWVLPVGCTTVWGLYVSYLSPHNNLWTHYYCCHLQMNKMRHRKANQLVQVLPGDARI